MPCGSGPGPLSTQKSQEPPSPRGRAALRSCLESDRGLWGAGPMEPPALWSLTASPISLAELLPHLGGLQLQGHEAAFPAEVRLLRVPPSREGTVGGGGRGEDTSPETISLSIPPGPLCWLLWPSWTPSRKWLTWPPTPEVGRGRGWRLGRPQVRLGRWKG